MWVSYMHGSHWTSRLWTLRGPSNLNSWLIDNFNRYTHTHTHTHSCKTEHKALQYTSALRGVTHNTTHIRVILVLQNEGPGLLKKACIVWRSADKIRDVTVARTVSSAHRQGLGGTGGRSKGKEKGRGDGGEEMVAC